MPEPDIDVVVPCYRYGRFLRQCVDSVLSQSGVHVRVLIIDDASPDDSASVGAQLAAEDSRVTFSRHEKNKGHIDTYNEGIEWATAPLMLLLSADDYLLPGALSRAKALMLFAPETGFLFGNALLATDDGQVLPIHARLGRHHPDPACTMSGSAFISLCGSAGSATFVPTPTAVVRTSLLKKLGGYRHDLPHTADLEMWLRLAAWAPVGFLREEQAVYRMHGSNMSVTYQQNHWLPDLHQRLAAFKVFAAHAPRELTDRDALYRELTSSLARTALGYARSAYNEGHIELMNRLRAFALEADPNVRSSLSWRYLVWKQRVGLRHDKALLTMARKTDLCHGMAQGLNQAVRMESQTMEALRKATRQVSRRARQFHGIFNTEGLAGLQIRGRRALASRLAPEGEPLPVKSADVLSADLTASRNGQGLPLRAGQSPMVNWVTTPPSPGSGGHTTLFRIINFLQALGYDNRGLSLRCLSR